LFLAFVTGCSASWKSVPFGTGPGYDVYRPEPYLLVLATGVPRTSGEGRAATTQSVQVQYTAKITYLPNYAIRYRVKGQGSFSSQSLWIQDGWNLVGVANDNTSQAMEQSLLGVAGSPVVSGGLAVAPLVGDQSVSASGSAPAAVPAGSSESAPLFGLNPSPGEREIALFKIVYGSDGRVSGLVRIMPASDMSSAKATLSQDNPPGVPP
jgi:hypothetical protein